MLPPTPTGPSDTGSIEPDFPFTTTSECSTGSERSARRKPSRTQESRRTEAEQRLLEAAMQIVAQRGTERMTLADVGLAAGYSRGLAAHRFGTKQQLLQKLTVYIGHTFDRQRLNLPRRQPGLDGLKGAIELYFALNDRSSTATRAMLVLMSEALLDDSGIHDGVAGYNNTILRGLEANIRAGQAKGEIRDDLAPRAAAALLIGAMRGVMMQCLLHQDIPLQTLQELMLRIVDDVLTKNETTGKPAKSRASK